MKRYETSDANTRGVWIFVVCLTATVVAVCFAIGLMMRMLGDDSQHPASRDSGPGTSPPSPTLQLSTRADMDQYRADQKALLDGYGWIDRDAGTVRIPIERAMEIVATRGIPPTDQKLTPVQMRTQKAEQP